MAAWMDSAKRVISTAGSQCRARKSAVVSAIRQYPARAQGRRSLWQAVFRPFFSFCLRTTPIDERYDVRSAGVADWKTSAGGNTERTLTA